MTLEELSNLMDSKLEPIRNSVKTIETDMHAIKTHVELINTRLGKLEERQAKTDIKLDQALSSIRDGQHATA